MFDSCIYAAGHTPVTPFVLTQLRQRGFRISPLPCNEVTHLLLPIPSFGTDGRVQGGGRLEDILESLPRQITVIGGNLQHPLLQNHHTLDLLQDPLFLGKNASITAHCALSLAQQLLPCTLDQCPVLVIGWGRIGKCLVKLLKQVGAKVTVAVRKPADRAMLGALGYPSVDTKDLDPTGYRLVINTVPSPVLSSNQEDALMIDLASGIGIEGDSVIRARGLPGKHAPESSGKLIAQTITRLLTDCEVPL